ADVTGSGGTVKRYEIHPDANRLKRYGITLQQLQDAVSKSNGNVGGDYLKQGHTLQVVRSVGVIGGGKDPMELAVSMATPEEAAACLRAEDEERLQEIRRIVVAAINHVPIRVDDLVSGGPLPYEGAPSVQGVVVGNQTRLGRVGMSKPIS